MARDSLREVVRHLSAVGGSVVESTDQQMLERFVARRDEDAFAALVRRHGHLVWGVCWRALRHAQDAEDAFQATFLALARRAASVRWRESVANWLYGAASRVAAEVRSRNARDRARQGQGVATPHERPAPDTAARELCAALDEELNRLPERYRVPLLLCYLEGCTSDQAARRLGWSLRTLERRLAQGRERLRDRLTRRGLTLSAVLLTVTLSGEAASAAMPADLAAAATTTAVSPAASDVAVAALADATSKAMTVWHSKLIVLAAFLTATLGVAFLLKTGLWDYPPARAGAADMPDAEPKAAPPAGATKEDATPGPASLARRVWAVMDVIGEKHLAPPSRKDMTLAGAKALLKAIGTATPDDLARRAADVTTAAQLTALFRDLWPGGAAQADRDGKLEVAALGGFLDSFPDRPAIHTGAQVALNEQLRSNRYVGIGVSLTANEKERFPQIVIPFRRGAAHTAGAKPGDLLIEIDGKNAKGVLDLEKVIGWLRGAEGTSVTAVVRQPDSNDTRTLKMVRAVIPFDSVFGYRRAAEDVWDYRIDRDAGIAYVWVQSIKSSTLHELRQVERRLRADGAKAVVLDLRFSVGDGSLHDVALLSDGLLDGGLMWSVRGKDEQVKEYRADREALFRGWPIVALVNDSPDNCQALLVAALRDNDRAVLVGEPTNNDGLVRSRFPLPDGKNAVTVLTGRLERAVKDRGWPVRPDHAVALEKEKRGAVQRWLADKQLPELPPGADDRPPEDPQLDRALSALRQTLKD